MVEQLQQDNAVEIDGNLYDKETGEFLQSVGRKSDWLPQDASDYEWLGGKLAESDAEVAAIEARRKFYNDNFDAMVRDAKRKKDGLLWKFGRMIEDFAKGNLPKGKKTWTCPTMSVAFKAHGEDVFVEDKKAALAWAQEKAPEAIVQKPEFQITKMDPATKASLIAQKGLGGPFKYRPAGETATIKTSS